MAGYCLSLELPRDDVAAVEAALEQVFDNGAGGMPAIGAFEVDGAPGQWRIDAYFPAEPPHDALQQAQAIAEQTLSGPLPPFFAAALPETDWVALSQASLPPIETRHFFIHGAHDRDKAPDDKIRLEIEAGQAFGTGRHGTTLGCLLALEALAEAGWAPASVLDVGTGTGLLAFAAWHLWQVPTLATDLDSVAIDVLGENARLNRLPEGPGGLSAQVAQDVQHADIQARAPYDLVIANILAAPLVDMAPRLAACLSPRGHLILSGLLQSQEPAVATAYAAQGLAVAERRPLDEWQTLVLTPA